jgi:DNA-directed RNA polymerase III subunit RPC3
VQFTTLKSRVVRASILVLVQHNILWRDHTEEEGEVLEFNVDECLMRVRFGRFVWQAEELFGEKVGILLSFFLLCLVVEICLERVQKSSSWF